MCITEYNEAETMRMFKEEGREEAFMGSAPKVSQMLAKTVLKMSRDRNNKSDNLRVQIPPKRRNLSAIVHGDRHRCLTSQPVKSDPVSAPAYSISGIAVSEDRFRSFFPPFYTAFLLS